MADYIVTSGELTTVANAIREKNGTSSNLSWPDGFVSGISSGSGGGGSSDFSTAEVTVINDSSSELYTPSLVWHDDEQLFAGFNLDPHSETTFEVVLYKGQQALDNLFKGSQVIVDGTGIAVTGDIENRSDEYEVYIVITGDCTITIS